MNDDRGTTDATARDSVDCRRLARARWEGDDDQRPGRRRAMRMVPSAASRENADQIDDSDASRSRPANPSAHGILSFAELLASGNVEEVYIYGRESTRKQDLESMLKGSRRRIKKAGGKVVHAFGDKGKNGNSLDPAVRPELVRALNAARRRGKPLVAPVFSRFLRAADYDARYFPNAKPTAEEIAALLILANGVTLVTLNDPDADPPDDESFLRQLRAEVKRHKVGRPAKSKKGDRKRRKKKWFEWARRKRREGMTYEEIADAMFDLGVEITAKTIRQWTHDVEQANKQK